jgi:hypothetical protein
LKLPAGFNVSEIELHDLHEYRPRTVGYEQTFDTLRIPTHMTARAAWLILKPAAAK